MGVRVNDVAVVNGMGLNLTQVLALKDLRDNVERLVAANSNN